MTVTVDWVDLASDEDLARLLGPELVCPRCGLPLRRDTLWSRPYFVDDENHAYSNVRVLVEELRERGWLPANPLRPRRWTDRLG